MVGTDLRAVRAWSADASEMRPYHKQEFRLKFPPPTGSVTE